MDGIDKIGSGRQVAAEPSTGDENGVDVINTKSAGTYDFGVAEDKYELEQGEAVVVYDDGMFGVLRGDETESLSSSEIAEVESLPRVVDAGNYDQRATKAGFGDHNLSEGELNRAAFDATEGELPAYVQDNVVKYNTIEEDVQEPEEPVTDEIVIFGQGEFNEVF